MNTVDQSMVLQSARARAHVLRPCPPGITPWLLLHCVLLFAFVANLTVGQGPPVSEPVVADETTEATITWLGGSGEWSAGANWIGGVAPGAGDTAVVSSGTVTISEGTVISVAGFTLSGGTLNGAGQLNITGLFTWTIGTMTGTGTTHVAVGGTYSIEGGNTRVLGETRQFVTAGDGTWSSFGALSFAAGSVWENQGALALTTTGSLSGGTFNNTVSGTVTRSGSGTSHLAGTFNNAGTVSVVSGTLQLSGNGSDTGTYNISADAAVAMTTGARTLQSGASIAGAAAFVQSGGTLTVTGTVPAVNYRMNGGTLNGAGQLNITGLFTWTIGTMTGTGTTHVAVGGTYSIEGGNTRVLGETRQFVTAGDGTWSSFGALSFAAGSVWENQGALALTTTGSLSGGTFNNTVSGTVTRSGSGTSHIANTFNNAGTVNVASGTLQLSGNGSDTGTYNISADAVLLMTAGARTLQSGASIAGAAAFVQSGGTLTVAGNIPAVNYRMNGGTLNGAGQLNITGLFTWTIGTMTGTGTTHVAVGGTYSIEGGNTRVL
ncbi:MAG TPA: hypothetical protein VMM36_05445, partial [Opitutaceae bacterium]|nr:hypothetical protein [Opitutaceae bacterium]